MVAFILPANSATGGYEIDNSLRFNDGDSPELLKTLGTATNRKKFTISLWFKRTTLSAAQYLVSAGTNNASDIDEIRIHSGNYVNFAGYDGSTTYKIRSAALLRDTSAWYHLVVNFDSTQGTDTNRLKMYINGEQVTSFTGSNVYPNQNFEPVFNENTPHNIGRNLNGSSYNDGYMSDFNFIDGQALDSSYFGETNDNGVWIPKKYEGTYGNNGFFLEFQQTGTSQNSSGMGADTSGNDNHFAVTNLAATDVTVDTPTNNFCTMNPLISFAGASDGIDAFTEGNTVVDSNNDTSAAGATFGVQNGKWYYEAKLTTGNQSSTNFATGWASTNYEGQKGTGNGVGFMSGEDNIAVDPGGNLSKNSSSTSVFGNRSTNDIFQVAIDLDNGKIHFGVNGTYSNGSATNSTTLDANNPDYSSVFDTAGEFYMPAFAQGSTGQTVLAYNFGNPAFAISSGNADANGYGNFEYAVPSGYYALCTKNLAEYG